MAERLLVTGFTPVTAPAASTSSQCQRSHGRRLTWQPEAPRNGPHPFRQAQLRGNPHASLARQPHQDRDALHRDASEWDESGRQKPVLHQPSLPLQPVVDHAPPSNKARSPGRRDCAPEPRQAGPPVPGFQQRRAPSRPAAPLLQPATQAPAARPRPANNGEIRCPRRLAARRSLPTIARRSARRSSAILAAMGAGSLPSLFL